MSTIKTVQVKTKNKAVVDFIKAEIQNKKERHAKIVESITPEIIQNLKAMKKIAISVK